MSRIDSASPTAASVPVHAGDTLSGIAARNGTTVSALLAANPQIRDADLIRVGQRIDLPAGGGPATLAHAVQRGETLSGIAQRYGTTVDALMKANPQVRNADTLYPDEAIQVPVSTRNADAPHAASTPSVYRVQPGDTLSSIAARQDTTVDAIVGANAITHPDRIYPGDSLVIPGHGPATKATPTHPHPAPSAPAHGGSTASGGAAKVSPGHLPDTKGLSESQKYDLYAGYVKQFGSAQAKADLANGKQVVLALRVDTNTRANHGNGVYDDRLVVLSQRGGGKQAQEFRANTEPSAQYEQGSPYQRKIDGQDANGDGRMDLGRLADGTYGYHRGEFLGAKALIDDGGQRAERDSNHDGLFTAADARQNKTALSGDFGMYVHIGGSNNTYSAGCFTLPPDQHAKFFGTLAGGQDHFNLVVVNTRKLAASAPAAKPEPAHTGSKTLTDADYQRAAKSLGVDVASIKAVASVESSGAGFLPDGRPKILFEAQQFHDHTGGRYDRTHPDISSPTWNRSLYKGGAAEYGRLAEAQKLDSSAALQSASWGKFQILGSNYRAAGYDSVESFVAGMKQSEGKQLDAFVGFVKANGLADNLKNHDWAGFARGYNGPGYAANDYDGKMARAYAQYSH